VVATKNRINTPFRRDRDDLQATKFKTWRTVELGPKFQTTAQFRVLCREQFHISHDANDILYKAMFFRSLVKRRVKLVLVGSSDLGLTANSHHTVREACDVAKPLGFKLCSAEVGLQLRLQYPDQERPERCYIGMEPIMDSRGERRLFAVEHTHEGICLSTIIEDDMSWNRRAFWVFER